MDNLLQVTIREVYGRETIYPHNAQAKRLAALVGTKTLTQGTLRDAMAMGFRLEYVNRFAASQANARSHAIMLGLD